MNRQQAHLLELLKDIHGICSRNDIRYFIWGGTLIGAARNKGFLPWDDDADIMMPYNDWKKFAKACETELPANRHLGAAELDERYCHIVPRFVSTDTTAIHTCQSLQDDVAGEAIDIFILDPIADGEGVYEAYLQDMHLYSAVVNYANVAGVRCELDAARYAEMLEIDRAEGRARAVELLEGQIASHHGDGSRYAWRWQSVSFCLERAWFDEPRLMRFEDTWLCAPRAVNECLTKYYGQNWAEIPNDITPAKHNAAFSLDVPYSEALEFYRPAIDRERLREQLDERKRLLLELAPEKNSIADRLMRCRAAIAAASAEATVARNRKRFDQALAERDSTALSTLLGSYLAEQTHADYLGALSYGKMRRAMNPVLIDVPDDIFEGGLVALLGADRLRPASRLLELRKACGKALTPLMRRVADALDDFQTGVNDYEAEDFQSGLGKAAAISRKWPQCSSFSKLACMCQRQVWLTGGEEAALDELERLVDEGADRWPGDGLFMKLKADCLEGRGARDEARSLYLAAAEHTRNGFALSEIAEKTGYWPAWMRETDWGKRAGIPQWSGEAAAMPAEPSRPAGALDTPGVFDERQWHLLDLLAEAARRLADSDVSCVLAPMTARALAHDKALPSEISGFSLAVAGADLDRALAALEGAGDARRAVKHGGEEPSVRYYDLKTLFCNVSSKLPGDLDALYVEIAPASDDGLLENTRQLEFAGRAFDAPAEVDARPIGRGSCKTGSTLAVPKHWSCTAALGAADLVEAGVLDPGDYDRRAELGAEQEEARQTSRQFKQNFAAIKRAVRAKDLSVKLPAKRKAVLAAIGKGDFPRAARALREYARAKGIVMQAKAQSRKADRKGRR